MSPTASAAEALEETFAPHSPLACAGRLRAVRVRAAAGPSPHDTSCVNIDEIQSRMFVTYSRVAVASPPERPSLALMAEGYAECGDEDLELAERDLAMSFETLPPY